jgi:transcriptional regulator with XRE-family HTH domain
MGKQPDIGEQLRQAIAQAERRGMTRAQVAILSGMTDSQIKRVAEGESRPRIDTAARIAHVIGYRIELVKAKG